MEVATSVCLILGFGGTCNLCVFDFVEVENLNAEIKPQLHQKVICLVQLTNGSEKSFVQVNACTLKHLIQLIKH